MLRRVTFRSTLAAFAYALSLSVYALADTPRKVDVPAGDLTVALQKLAEQSGVEFIYSIEQLRGVRTAGVHGEYTTEQAVVKLLQGTKLRVTVHESGAMLISAPGTAAPPPGARSGQADGSTPNNRGRLQLAQVDQGASAGPVAVSPDDAEATLGRSDQLEEVVVTAQKRAEKLLEVPSAITAVSGDRLQALQVSSLADLANYVPGLSVVAGGAPGYRQIVIRGLNTNYNNDTTGPMVGTYIDDLPVGSSSYISRGAQYGVDLNPYDVERVEVLKGPQGTLYGANTMGGLVKFSLRRPDLAQFQAGAGGDLQSINGSGNPSGGVRGFVNVPLIAAQLAIRVSGFYKSTAGYIDNVGLGAKEVNGSWQSGGLATLLWKVSDQVSVRATILAEDVRADNMTEETINTATQQPLFGPQTMSTRFPEPYNQQTRNYSLSADWNLGFATLTSATGWSRVSFAETLDLTVPYGTYTPGHPDSLALFLLAGRTSKFVEEVRLTSPAEQRLQWMLGGYYTNEHPSSYQNFPTFTPGYVPLPAADNLLIDNEHGTYKEPAGFANLTYKIIDPLDVSAGVRHSAYSQVSCTSINGVFGSPPAPCSSLPSTGVTVWMTNARWHLNQDAMLYARVATGYRPGSGCPTCGDATLGTPGIVNPDRTTNYELGFKGEFLERRLQLDLSAFYIDWTNIQLPEVTPNGFGYPGNGGGATSTGFEAALVYQPMDGLRLNATLDHTDAHLTDDAKGAGGKDGDQLPDNPLWTASLTADYAVALDKSKSLLFGGGYRYKDAIVNQFAHSAAPEPMGPQNIVDVYTGFVLRNLTMRLTALNVFNNRSYTGLLYLNDPAMPKYVPTQPRTIGLNVNYLF